MGTSLFVEKALASTLNICMPATMNIAPAFASVWFVEPSRQKKLFRSYWENVDYLLKKSSNDQATAEMNFKFVSHTQPTNMTLMQYADAFSAKSCKVADVYDESTLNNISIEKVVSSICNSLRKYWVFSPQTGLSNIALKEQSLLAIQNERAKSPHAGTQNATAK